MSFAQTSAHPSKFLLTENDLETGLLVDVIQIPPIPDELKPYSIKENAFQNFFYEYEEGLFLFEGGIRVIEFSTFDMAKSYYDLATTNLGDVYSDPNSSYLNQNANCKLAGFSLESSDTEEFWYLFCMKFPLIIQRKSS